MNWMRSCVGVLGGGVAMVATLSGSQQTTARFVLQPRDHISIIGNTLAERFQYDGWLETLLHARYPKHELTIRNLGFSGDEVTTRLRSKNFGNPDEWLGSNPAPIGGYQENRFAGTNVRSDVIFAFFGYNESYAGEAGLPAFEQQLTDWIKHTASQRYNGKTAPRIVVFSPIAHEDLGNPDLPDGKENNPRLELYTRAMERVAKAQGVMFVDLFTTSARLYAATPAPLTINGVHLNAEGNREIAQVIDRALVRRAAEARRGVPVAAAAGGHGQGAPLVPALSRDGRLFDVRRPRVSDVRAGHAAQRQCRDAREDARRGHAADQLRHAAARVADPGRDDAQSRSTHLGAGGRRLRRAGRSEGRRLRHAAVHRREDELPDDAGRS